MVSADSIFRYFTELTDKQKHQYSQLYDLYTDWNSKINVISRKDIESLYIHHVLHSLGVVKFTDFSQVHTVLDVGTGGGFPGIPLAIMFPDIEFHLVDSIAKKIQVVQGVSEAIGLKNVKAEQARAEQIRAKYDMVTCRAVTRLAEFYGWIHKNLKPDAELICLKGGDLVEEIYEFKSANRNKKVEVFELKDVFDDPFFETKKVLRIVNGGGNEQLNPVVENSQSLIHTTGRSNGPRTASPYGVRREELYHRVVEERNLWYWGEQLI